VDDDGMPHVAVMAVLSDRGSRRKPLALSQVAGQPLYVWSLRAMLALNAVGPLTLLAPARLAAKVAASPSTDDQRPLQVVPVPTLSTDACFQALSGVIAALPVHISVVAFHDVTIPIIEAEFWSRALAAVDDQTACAAALPVHDTIKLTHGDGIVHATLPRAELRSIQTPLLLARATLQRVVAGMVAEDSPPVEPNATWWRMLVNGVASAPGVRLRLVPAGANSHSVRSARDLSPAADWISSALTASG
jgi:2-C-methyl-D-erythritol 4-phosphate cytidylyltransferase